MRIKREKVGPVNTPSARRAPRKWLRFSLAALILGGAGTLIWRLAPRSRAYYTDAERIREPAESVTPRDVLWQPPVRLSDAVNSPADDYEPRLSADGMTLFFVRGKAGENADIYICRKTAKFSRDPQGSAVPQTFDGWCPPEPLADINSTNDDLGPEPSSDGSALYFYSNRPGGSGGYDLWVAHRGEEGWRSPINLGPRVNSPFNDYGPALTPDGGTLYFSSNRPQPQDLAKRDEAAWTATIREDLFSRDYDLFAADITDQGVGAAAPLAGLNTPQNEGAPAISPSGDFLYFASDRPGGNGGFDLYRARRLRGEYLPAANLGSQVNSAANELDPALSLGGFALLFSSDRRDESTQTPDPPHYELYQTASREVFTESEVRHANIDWAGLWSQIGPSLLWALLSLLLLLLLVRLLGGLRSRKLSLLVRCFLASACLHLLLMFLLSFWRVSPSIADAIGRPGGVKVALVSSSQGGGIAGQILGGLIDVRPEPLLLPSLQAEVSPPETSAAPVMAALDPARQRIVTESNPISDPVLADAAAPVSPAAPVAAPLVDSAQARVLELKLPQTVRAALVTEASVVAPAFSNSKPNPASWEANLTDSSARPAEVALAPIIRPAADQGPVLLLAESFSVASDATTGLMRTPAQFPPTEFSVPPYEAPYAIPQAASGSRVSSEETSPRPAAVAATSTRAGIIAAGEAAAGASIQFAELSPSAGSTPPAGATLGTLLGPSNNFDSVQDATPTFAAQPFVAPVLGGIASAVQPSGSAYRLPESFSVPGASGQTKGPTTEPAPLGVGAFAHSSRSSAPAPWAAGLSTSGPQPIALMPGPLAAGSSAAGRSTTSFASMGDAIADAEPALSGLLPMTGTAIGQTQGLPEALAFSLRVPTEMAPPENPYAQRQVEGKQTIVNRMGGSEETERAVSAALTWLAAHQSRDGRWDGDNFDERCGQCGGETDLEVNIGLSGLSLLCFLGANHTHVKDGPYRDTVNRGLTWLVAQQGSDGDLRGGETMYSHGIAAIAISEANGMTRDDRLAEPVRLAIRFIEGARNQRVGGWRYDPGQAGDTSVLGWQVMALKSAHMAGLTVSPESFAAAGAWLERVARPSRPGLYAYQPQRGPSAAMTAEGMFVQQLLGHAPDDARMIASAEHLIAQLPDWNGAADTYYWYYATLALFQHQGEPWRRWNEALTRELLAHQEKTGRRSGSWAPEGKWADKGGRVYQTALCTLMLEVYYRYLPLYSLPDQHANAMP